jgi:dynein heavy chain
MVPALYNDSEKEGLISSIRAELTQQSLPDSRDACWAAFVDKVRSNLHVVLAMSPVGDALRSRCRNFPGLVNNTVIDWFEPWPEQVRPASVLFLSGMAAVTQLRIAHRVGRVAAATSKPVCGAACRPCKVLPAPSWQQRSCQTSCGQR